ncbi:hypothetical protein ABZV34_23970 [Streptomyces sp. NPDC005195]|uniref:hypothetical protein n=1 Tax=Streptomyces sp. NPDC005195 TaxID=3154561 RepID=UPI0033BC2C1D
MSPSPADDRTALAVALLGSVLVAVVAVQVPALVSALTLGLATWAVLYVFLRL